MSETTTWTSDPLGKGKMESTGFDIRIEEVSFKQSRQRHDNSRVLQTAEFGFDI